MRDANRAQANVWQNRQSVNRDFRRFHDGKRGDETMRKNRLAWVAAYLMFGVTAACGAQLAASQASNGERPVQESFAGAWRLVLLERPGADGKPNRIDCCGMFVFTRDGRLSVQVMEKNPQPQTSAEPGQYAQGGYEASYGTFTVDARAHTFTFHVDGALVRTLIGKDLVRAYEFSGNRLIVKPARPDEHWRVVWERY
jgi:hypothetical protein